MNLNGKLAELYLMMWLLRRGYDVFQPIDVGSPVDVVWRSKPGAAFRSAQVKKVYAKHGHPTVNITRRDGDRYDALDVDYLAAVDYENGYVWLIRFRDICVFTRVRLGKKWDAYRRDLGKVWTR